MRKIGIMGGTFNPIHNAHLILAECSYEQFHLDKVWIMPSKNPPHKPKELIQSDEHRINMIRNAIEDNFHFELSTLELERDGITYTADTLQILKDNNPHDSYYFILGEDSLFNIDKWKRPDMVFQLAHIIVASRGGYSKEEIHQQIDNLKGCFQCTISVLDNPTIELSSSFIRENIREGKSIKYYVPEKVRNYIYNHHLYILQG